MGKCDDCIGGFNCDKCCWNYEDLYEEKSSAGAIFQVSSLEEMCDLMCDNKVPENRGLTGCTPHGSISIKEGGTMTMSKRNEATQRYQDKAMRRVVVKVNRFTEPDILEHLEKQDNIQGYIKELIKADMEKHRK